MPNTVKLNRFFYIIKVLMWFGGEDLGTFLWGLGFKPCWIESLVKISQNITIPFTTTCDL